MKNTSVIRTILFNVLVILTIIFIYIFFFPKKSYVNELLYKELKPDIDETFNDNINNMKIASDIYFENNSETEVTLDKLIEENLIAELKDTTGNACNKESYVKKEEAQTKIYLDCNEKKEEIIINKTNQDKKFICIYQYEKELGNSYTKWSDWSTWQEEKVESNDLTNVETKIEKTKIGTKKETKEKEITKEPIKQECPNNYIKQGNTCISKEATNKISAAKDYTCPSGYTLRKNMCYKGNIQKEPTIKYACPTDGERTHFELDRDTCKVYTVKRNIKEKFYTCEEGYKLSNGMCTKIETYEEEVDDYKEITMYKYQTREKTKKIDIKWSTKDDKKLLNEEYNMVGKLTCEI